MYDEDLKRITKFLAGFRDIEYDLHLNGPCILGRLSTKHVFSHVPPNLVTNLIYFMEEEIGCHVTNVYKRNNTIYYEFRA